MSQITQPVSTAFQRAPRLSSRGLTILLFGMCLVPIVTIGALKRFLPPVYEGNLEASVSAEGLPPGSFYDIDYRNRPPFESTGVLIVHNESDQEWTHVNIRINKHYQIGSRDAIPAGDSRRYRLDRFVSRTGARFQTRYNPVKYVQIYARRPSSDRATYSTDFDWESVQ